MMLLLPPLRGKDGMGGDGGVLSGELAARTPTSISSPQGGGEELVPASDGQRAA